MASKILGRTVCPIRCGHDAAHVKIKTDKEAGKTAYPYVYCPACTYMGHTKTEAQAKALAAITRPEKIDASHVGTPTGEANPTPTDTPAPKPSAPLGIFGLFGGANG